MKRDSRFSKRNSFFRDLTKGVRGVKTNTGNPPLKSAQIRPVTKTQGGGGLKEAGHVALMFTGEIHEWFQREGGWGGLCVSVLQRG